MIDMTSTLGLSDNKLYPIIPFNTIFDLDVSLICSIHDRYNDRSVFDDYILNHMSLLNWIALSITRFDPNPLSILIPNDIDKANELYHSFLTERPDEFYRYKIQTNLFKLSTLVKSSPAISPTILCMNDYEEEIIQNFTELPQDIIRVDSISNLIMSDYDVIYVKDIRDLLKIKKLEGKTIYISSCFYNYDLTTKDGEDEILLIQSIVNKLNKENVIKTFDLYDEKIKDYVPKRKEEDK